MEIVRGITGALIIAAGLLIILPQRNEGPVMLVGILLVLMGLGISGVY